MLKAKIVDQIPSNMIDVRVPCWNASTI